MTTEKIEIEVDEALRAANVELKEQLSKRAKPLLPLVQEAQRNAMPGCTLAEHLTLRWLIENDFVSQVSELRRKAISDDDFKAWLETQPEWNEYLESLPKPA